MAQACPSSLSRALPTLRRLRPAAGGAPNLPKLYLHSASIHSSPCSPTFFSLPSFPSALSRPEEVHSPKDLSVKDRYSQSGDVLVYKETTRLPYTIEQLYEVAADIESYPHFLPYCTGSRLQSSKPLGVGDQIESQLQTDVEGRPWLRGGYPGQTHLIKADLSVGFKGLQQSYASSIECRKYNMVKLTASHPELFKSFGSSWTFKTPAEVSLVQSILEPNHPAQAESSYVSLKMSLTLADSVHATLGELYWKAVSERMVQALQKRVEKVCGPPKRS